jgi:hypothetical protein
MSLTKRLLAVVASTSLFLTACGVDVGDRGASDAGLRERVPRHTIGHAADLGLLPAAPPDQYAYTDGALFRQNFENMTWLEGQVWSFDGLATIPYTTGGIDGTILLATYPPFGDEGPDEIAKPFDLSGSVTSATLSFDVKLHSQFEFVKGGKMHGLAGGTMTTGCDPIDPDGWSVRMMWRHIPETTADDARPELYIYHQDRDSHTPCGDEFPTTTGFTFQRGQWYRVELYVKMNTGIWAFDGRAMLYINGVLMVDKQGLRLTANMGVQIDKFLVSTFYGGDDHTWSPDNTTYAYFDNFTVQPGFKVDGNQGRTCEIFEEGVYNWSTDVCCAEPCDACGGSGCGSLPGGANNCCTGTILSSGRLCTQLGLAAPCYFP